MPGPNRTPTKAIRTHRQRRLRTPIRRWLVSISSDSQSQAFSDITNENRRLKEKLIASTQQLALERQEIDTLSHKLNTLSTLHTTLEAKHTRRSNTLSQTRRELKESKEALDQANDKTTTEVIRRQAATRKAKQAEETLHSVKNAFSKKTHRLSSQLDAAIKARDEAEQKALAAEKALQETFLAAQESLPSVSKEHKEKDNDSETSLKKALTDYQKHQTQGYVTATVGGLGLLLSVGGTTILAAQTPAVSFLAALATLNSGALIGVGVIAGLSLALLAFGIIKLSQKKPVATPASNVTSPIRISNAEKAEETSLGEQLAACATE